jgi:hypothetical protein
MLPALYSKGENSMVKTGWPVVIKYFEVLRMGDICNARSRQNVFRASFATSQEAVAFASARGSIVCEVQA